MTPFFRRVISASLSPNTEWDDVHGAVHELFAPYRWKNGSAIDEVEAWFRTYTGAPVAVSFDSGRSALFTLLRAFGITSGDEVIVQAFTCVAVPNAVLWSGARPIFADIDASLNIDPHVLPKLVTQHTKAIIVQHTFGIAASMDTILPFAKKHHLVVIEDCAHSLGVTYNGKKLGTIGDAAFFSFGRDKVLSSVWGGMAVILDNNRHNQEIKKLQQYQKHLAMPKSSWVVQQLLHPILFSIIIPTYNSGIGKLILVMMQKLHLLSYPVDPVELLGLQPHSPMRYPNAQATLLKHQLAKLKKYTNSRSEIVSYYTSALKNKGFVLASLDSKASLLRFPLFVKNKDVILKKGKSEGILLGNWYSHVIDPAKCDMKRIGYTLGSCPNAERVSSEIINLPTRITLSEARRIVDVLCS
jgi:dTDP-4-amino-4,6-dideoxygalactose transaminase